MYRGQILQVNTRWKALADIYTMHSFAPLWNRIPKNQEIAPLEKKAPVAHFLIKQILRFSEDFGQHWKDGQTIS